MQKEIILLKLGQKIREIRIKKNITQVELANSIGKDQQSIQRLETGNVNPSLYYLFEVTEALEIKLEDLLAGIKEK